MESGGTLQLVRRARGRGARPYEGRDVTAVGPRLISCVTIEDLIWLFGATSGAGVIVRIKAGIARKCDHKERRISTRRLLHEAAHVSRVIAFVEPDVSTQRKPLGDSHV